MTGHKEAQCIKGSNGWDARRITDKNIRHVNRESGRQQERKTGFQIVLLELAEAVNELHAIRNTEDPVAVMFGDLKNNSNDDGSHNDAQNSTPEVTLHMT